MNRRHKVITCMHTHGNMCVCGCVYMCIHFIDMLTERAKKQGHPSSKELT